MKLSTAILEGSKGIRQTRGTYKDGNSYCVLGAACRAVRIDPSNRFRFETEAALKIKFPELTDDLFDEIVTKNDEDQKTFKEIANWLKRKGL